MSLGGYKAPNTMLHTIHTHMYLYYLVYTHEHWVYEICMHYNPFSELQRSATLHITFAFSIVVMLIVATVCNFYV